MAITKKHKLKPGTKNILIATFFKEFSYSLKVW